MHGLPESGAVEFEGQVPLAQDGETGRSERGMVTNCVFACVHRAMPDRWS